MTPRGVPDEGRTERVIVPIGARAGATRHRSPRSGDVVEPNRAELQGLRRRDLPARARDRLEMSYLSDAGWQPTRIAGHLGPEPGKLL
jgi:hypothetical protein